MPVLGLDTSCYTTSVALVDGSCVVADKRLLLKVPEGGRGLQQSNALFQHVQNLPVLIDELGIATHRITAVAASVRPRPQDGSYMPVFTAGQSAGKLLASALGVPFYETSHQEGHIAAGCFSLGIWPEKPFLAFHLSGGTTELLRTVPTGAGFHLDIAGSTSDLHAGQVVDRVGVALGLGFPAGPALEILAAQHDGHNEHLALKAPVSGTNCSLSGMESAAQRLIAAGTDAAAVAHGVQECLAGAFIAMAVNAAASASLADLLVIGGVASNQYIRSRMIDALANAGIHAMFAVNPFSSDNAVGVAAIGQNFLYDRGAK